jgi:Transglutaminase-like superfamily
MTPDTAFRRTWNWARRIAGCVASDCRLSVRLLLWRAGLPLMKHTMSLPALVRLMHAAPGARPNDSSQRDRVSRITSFLARGGRTLVSANCLERSLVQYRLLSEAGVEPTLVLGASPSDSPVAGHAWVEVDQKPVEQPPERFVPVLVFGADGRPLLGADPRRAA